jgi:hypothetical protein
MQVCTMVSAKTALTEAGNPFRPSQTKKKVSATPRLRSSVSTASQYFAKAHGFAQTCARWRLNCHGFGRRASSTWSAR